MTMPRLCVGLSVWILVARAQLGYVESSQGFQNNPRLCGGRTELELADINNDGHVDILSIGDHGSPFVNSQQRGVMVWFGDGTGNWTLYMPDDTFGYGGIAVGDVNNDGHWDVGYGMHHNSTRNPLGDGLLEVALGDGTGRNWTAWGDSLAREGQTWGMHATDFGDFDNDGLLDVGSISFGAGDGLHVYKNLGNGAWRRTFGFLGGNSSMEFYFRDGNRDGNQDIIAAHGTGSIWFGDGLGNFTPADSGLPPPSGYALSGLSVGDVDNDGGCDIAFVNETQGVDVWTWNDELRRWTSFSGSLPRTDSFEATQLCDMNADGFVDLLAFGRGVGRCKTRVWLGDGAGNWTQAAEFATPSASSCAALRTGADFDHNDRPDIVFWAREGSWPNDRNVARAFKETTPVESLGIFPVFPRGGEKFKNGSVQFTDWWSSAPAPESSRVKLELSTQGRSGPWQLVADSLRNGGRYQWTVPAGVTSPDCFLRYTAFSPQTARSTLTPRPFAVGDTVVGCEAAQPVGQGNTALLVESPARGRVSLKLGRSLATPAFAVLCDVLGREMARVRVSPGAEYVTFAVPESPSGACFVRLESDRGCLTRKVVLQP